MNTTFRVWPIWLLLLLTGCQADVDGTCCAPPPKQAVFPCLADPLVKSCVAVPQVVAATGAKTVTSDKIIRLPSANLAPGGTLDMLFTVRNLADKATAAALRIDKVALTYLPLSPDEGQDGTMAIECWTADGTQPCHLAKWPDVVPPPHASLGVSEAHFLSRVRKIDDKPRHAKLILNFNNVGEKDSELTVLLEAGTGVPKVVWTPDSVYLEAPAAQGVMEPVVLLNVGDGLLMVQSFEVDLPPNVKLQAIDGTQLAGAVTGTTTWTPQEPIHVLPGGSLKLQLDYVGSGTTGASGNLKAICNDPSAVALYVHATPVSDP